jgi:hypothetical protein
MKNRMRNLDFCLRPRSLNAWGLLVAALLLVSGSARADIALTLDPNFGNYHYYTYTDTNSSSQGQWV